MRRFALEKTERLWPTIESMNSLPLELRRRIVVAYERKEGTYFELAQRFGVGEATVHRLLRLQRERGDVTPGAPSGISEDELPQFARLVSEFPGATLEQLKRAWAAHSRRELSRSSIVRALRRAGIIRKKAPRRSAPAPAERGAIPARKLAKP